MVTIAILGCGSIGKRHAKWADKYGTLMAVCDINQKAADELAKEYNCEAYYNYDEMLKKQDFYNSVELIAVCTPNGMHAADTINALESGYHVLCEKPMALNIEDCERMISTAEHYNKRLFIVKQNRFNEPIQLLKKMIDDNKLGEILSVHLNCIWNRNADYYKKSKWTGTYNMDGGILFTQFSHFIDLLYYLVGDIKKVYALCGNLNHYGIIQFPDTVVTAFKFNNGTLGTGHFSINSYEKSMEGSITILGEKGAVQIGGKYLDEIKYQHVKDCDYYIPAKSELKSRHDAVYQNVCNTLNGDEHIMTSALDGLKTVQIIKKIEEACK